MVVSAWWRRPCGDSRPGPNGPDNGLHLLQKKNTVHHSIPWFQPTIWLWSQMWYFVTVINAFLFHLWDLVIYIFEKVTSRVSALLNSALDWVITPSWWTKQSWRHIIKLEIAHNLRTRVRKIFNCAIFNIKKNRWSIHSIHGWLQKENFQ